MKRRALDIELHPLLADSSVFHSTTTSLIPKPSFATAKANIRAGAAAAPPKPKEKKPAEPKTPAEALLAIQPEDMSKNNPYFDPHLSTGRRHEPRQLKFHQKGKFISLASQMRTRAQMEQLRREVAEGAKMAGVDVDVVADMLRSGVDSVPSRAEWWDIAYLNEDEGETPNYSTITPLIQRPVLIPPPFDPDVMVAPRPLFLTRTEQKKLRRQRRLQEHAQKQDLIKAGLLPPEPSRVKIANLATVLAKESVAEPSRVEAEVQRQAAQREAMHRQANEERKLTPEARAAKKRNKLFEDTSAIVHVAVFRVDSLENPQWRFKLYMNARQSFLSGCAIIYKGLNLVVVEGGPKGIKRYKNLMLRRITWNESGAGEQCKLVWEGTVKERAFEKFETKEVETEIDAREYLGRRGLDHYWTLAL